MVQVTVSEGTLEGERATSITGETYYSFKGIPYAAPPVGDLRFKPPQPPIPWQGVRSAKEHGDKCYQFNFMARARTNGSEDCLFLNVYTPQLAPLQPLPVMIFIHGGGFVSGSGDDDVYGPDFLVRNDVILVTLNYRLEVLGFLCLDIPEAPGNAGAKDQVAAMRWVQKNISKFGGDPNNVTIFGQSAGASCVTMHCLSPMTKGLFRRAIAQSGCMMNHWFHFYRPKDRAMALAEKLGCSSKDEYELLEFLKSQPIENLVEVTEGITIKEHASDVMQTIYCIVPEKEFPGVEAWYTGGDVLDYIRNNVHDGVELMIGHNDDDGIINISATLDLNKTILYANRFVEYFCPRPLAFNCSFEDQFEIGTKIREYYLKNKKLSKKNLDALSRYYTAESFKIGIWPFAKQFSIKNKVYYYKFKCKTERNFFVKLCGLAEYFRTGSVVCHIDDIAYLFPIKSIKQNISKSSPTFKSIHTMTKLWTNFAKTGNPTPDTSLGTNWRQFKPNSQNYIDIGPTLVRGITPDREEQQFWEGIFNRYLPEGDFRNPE